MLMGIPGVNTRVEEQMRGRAARQGAKGSSEVIVNIEKGGFIERLSSEERELLKSVVVRSKSDPALSLGMLQFLRELHGYVHSAVELYKTPFEETHDGIVAEFFESIRDTISAIQHNTELTITEEDNLKGFMLSEWAHVYGGYDRERALVEIRLSDAHKKALTGSLEGIDKESLAATRKDLSKIVALYRATLHSLHTDEQSRLETILDDFAIYMTLGQSAELYAGCVEYIAKLKQTVTRVRTECLKDWKEILNQARLDAIEDARMREEEKNRSLDKGSLPSLSVFE